MKRMNVYELTLAGGGSRKIQKEIKKK